MKDLKVISDEMLPVLENENGEKFVKARELHERLLVSTRFNDWISRMIKNYGYKEGFDFYSFLSKTKGRPSSEYFFTLDTGKELAMVQGNEMGRAIRRYFIEVEKQARKLATEYPKYSYMIEDPAERARMWIKEYEEKQSLANTIETLEPKAAYYDYVLQSDSLIRITEISKDYGMSGRQLNTLLHDSGVVYNLAGTWLLYSRYAKKGYTQSKTIKLPNGGTKLHTYWTQEGRLFIYELLKRQGILPTMERKEVADYEVAY